MKHLSLVLLCGLGLLLNPWVIAVDNLLITEFMAVNNNILADEDGAYPDWVEIWNSGTNGVNLDGWYLTDSFSRLTKWRFPATNLPPNAYLVVFASGKDRRVPGAPLHTSFQLSSDGEYLGLVAPDGTNVVSAYSPTFPPQTSDVSFGIHTATEAALLVDERSPVRVMVPADGAAGQSWTAVGFDDSGWIRGTNGVGYEAVRLITDDFNTYHNYNGGNVSGTIWDGVHNAANLDPGSDTTGGVLHWRNTGEGFESPNQNGAPFLYKLVTGDFSAEVQYVDTPNADYSDGGLMVRVPNLQDAGPGEDYMTLLRFNANCCSDTVRVRWTDDGGTANNFQIATGHNFFRMVRLGDRFYFYSKQNAGDAWMLGYTLDRPDFHGLAVQVGLQHGTFSNSAADRQFDNFVLMLGGAGQDALSYQSILHTDMETAMYGAAGAGINASAYLRIPFVLTNVSTLAQLALRMRYDDGFVAYLNGVEIARRNAPATVDYNASATAKRTHEQAFAAELINLTDRRDVLLQGNNLLAIHGLNVRADDIDFFMGAELETRSQIAVASHRQRYFVQPTPGAANGEGTPTLAAVIEKVSHTPVAPADTDDLQITAGVRTTFAAVTNVLLHYRVMFSNEVTVPMLDDGAHGDGTAGDRVFGAAIPADASRPGQMVRWYVTAQDAEGGLSRAPLFANPVESPQYFGTVIANSAIQTQLPVFQYFIENTNWYKLPNNGPYDKNWTNASVYYQARFYDNVRVRIRGASMVIHKFPKQSLKFDFPTGQHFYYAPDRELAEEVNINNFWTDKAYIRNFLSMDAVYREAGVVSQDVFYILTCLNGNLHSLASFVEEPDQRWLRRHGLDPDGALYKMYNSLQEATIRPPFSAGVDPDTLRGAEKKSREWESFSDLETLVNGLKSTNVNRVAFIYDNVDIPQIINYCAASLIFQDWDRYPKNHFMYRDTEGTRLWQMLPWDADLSWGYAGWFTDDITATHATFSHPLYGQSDYVGPYGQWHVLVDAIYRTPALRQMFLRRARTLLDEILQPPGTAADKLKLEARMDQVYAAVAAEAEADKQRWGMPFGTNQTFLQALNTIKNNYLAPRRTHLFVTHGPPSGLIPDTQFPYPNVRFGAIDFNPASRQQAQEFIQLTNSNPFAMDMSGWRLEGGVQYTFKPGTVMPSNSVLYLSPDVVTFRARTAGPRGNQSLLVLGNYQGQLSSRGEALRLYDAKGRLVQATNYLGSPSLAQQFLRVTEIMYNPAPYVGNTNDAQEFEFIELKNISPTVALDLAGVRFTDGILFDFTGSAVTNLGPGETVLVVRNLAAFNARYGSRSNLAGQYAGGATNFLDNAGERLRLVDAAGEEILDFTFNDTWHGLADGLGFSLVVADETAEPDAWNDKTHWRSSSDLGGSPGAANSPMREVAPIVINEVLTRTDLPPPTDTIELYNPTGTNVNIGGWLLTDDFNTPRKYRIPDDTMIPANGYVTFDEAQFNPTSNTSLSFSLSSQGDEVYLFSADAAGNLTGYVHGFDFGPAEDGVSFGRHVTSTGDEHFVPQNAFTPRAANASPRVGPVVITEIMYHPPDMGTNDNADDEFIELLNISSNAVPLFESFEGQAPTNTWRLTEAVDFTFPTNLSLVPGEYILVVNFDPLTNATLTVAFRARYAVPAAVRLFGPYGGRLDNASDRIELKKPVTPQLGVVPYVIVDRVEYRDGGAWPVGADGYGMSLQRKNAAAYGNDPANWTAALPAAAGATGDGVAPVITSQPASQSLLAYTPASLSVSASGGMPLGYQWRQNGVNVPGATNAVLWFDRIAPEQGGNYQVLVFNRAGSVLSSNVTITLQISAVITRQPGSLTIRQGQTATFSVTSVSASGSALSYQWRLNGVDLSARTNAILTLTNVQIAQAGNYTVRITDAVGTIESLSAELNVVILPAIVQHPLSQSVVAGGTVTFSVAATGTLPMHYQWRVGATRLANYNLNQGVSFFTLTNVQANQAGLYRVVITNAASPTGIASSTATLTVLADDDQDGLPNEWESAFGLILNDPADATVDADGDTMSNWQEYIAGTDPTNALSCLKINWLSPGGAGARLEFQAISNRTYTVEFNDALGTSSWQRLSDWVARPTNRVEVLIDSQATHRRFYRVVTPRQP